jgi:predicted nucleic acid-binding protein
VSDYVADTHALLWYLTDSPRLGPNASAAFDDAANGKSTIYISAIVVAELYYLNKKLGVRSTSTAKYVLSSKPRSLSLCHSPQMTF